jgi:hypothetical protein
MKDFNDFKGFDIPSDDIPNVSMDELQELYKKLTRAVRSSYDNAKMFTDLSSGLRTIVETHQSKLLEFENRIGLLEHRLAQLKGVSTGAPQPGEGSSLDRDVNEVKDYIQSGDMDLLILSDRKSYSREVKRKIDDYIWTMGLNIPESLREDYFTPGVEARYDLIVSKGRAQLERDAKND